MSNTTERMSPTGAMAIQISYPFEDRRYSDSENFLMLFLETDSVSRPGASQADETQVWVNHSSWDGWTAESNRYRSSWIKGAGYASREEDEQPIGLAAAYMAFQ